MFATETKHTTGRADGAAIVHGRGVFATETKHTTGRADGLAIARGREPVYSVRKADI